ncbi:acyl-coenzyme A synthetase ACSM4, mitochondrial isoform X2 [Ornithorhynchus anatinus]|uniref:acyl-coenzyme A synthetase ACSM4, mitochondrial isoform X2 n=1 Tax=Ornithorhynchus anatinus TaxID=9258 RepID=UPI0010A934A4|nr:acyl-coenzyme A synthetase ACSM4, mitochondrial isoform X2 [Ornithorhynchus anatinus]
MKKFPLPWTLWVHRPSSRWLHRQSRVLVPQKPAATEILQWAERELPEEFNFASDVLDQWARVEKDGKEPRHPALWWVDNEGDEVKWSFEELGIFSRQAANVLSENCGLKRGDRVAVILPRVPQWWLVCVGCMRAGLIFMPGTTQLTGKDIQYRLQVSKAKCVVTSDGVAPEVDSIVSSCPTLKTKLLVSDAGRAGWLSFNELLKTAPKEHKCVKSKSREPLAIYFTSGSTGSPKMVLHSHGSLGFQAVKYDRSWLSLTDADILWSTSDTGWIVAAILALFGSWSVGAGVFVHRLERFEPATILTTLSRFPITALSMAPTAYRLMVQNLESRKPLGRLRHCISAGEPLNPEVMEKWKASTGLEIRDVYGQTETGVVCAVTKEMKIKPGSMGKPTAAYDVQVVDENANILPPGMEGDIGIRIKPTRPFSLFSGYVDNPEKTAATERGNFYICGDRGVKDEDGYFWFLGRADDIINSSGYRIGPFEVESALIEHPAVVESAVVSSPDPVRGERSGEASPLAGSESIRGTEGRLRLPRPGTSHPGAAAARADRDRPLQVSQEGGICQRAAQDQYRQNQTE